MEMKYSNVFAALLALGLGTHSDSGNEATGTVDSDFPETPEPDPEALRERHDMDAASWYFKGVCEEYPENVHYWDVRGRFPDGAEVVEIYDGYALISDATIQTFLMVNVRSIFGSVSYKSIDWSAPKKVENRRNRIIWKQKRNRFTKGLSRYFYGEELPDKVHITIHRPRR